MGVKMALQDYETWLLGRTPTMGWIVVIWGGLVQGSLFRLLDDRDFWLVFALWMSENITKYMYMYPEGDFNRQNGTDALRAAAKGVFLRRCWDNGDHLVNGVAAPGEKSLDMIGFFDLVQFGFAFARLVLGALAVQAMRGYSCTCQWYLDQGVCLGGSCSNCNDGGHFNYHPRVCAALWVFYIIVLVKACLMVVKYFFVILMCDFATLDDRVKALTTVLVHQHHGMFLQTDDMEA